MLGRRVFFTRRELSQPRAGADVPAGPDGLDDSLDERGVEALVRCIALRKPLVPGSLP